MIIFPLVLLQTRVEFIVWQHCILIIKRGTKLFQTNQHHNKKKFKIRKSDSYKLRMKILFNSAPNSQSSSNSIIIIAHIHA